MDTLELKIDLVPKEPWSEIIIAELAEYDFDSFVETENGLIAYAQANLDVEEILKKTLYLHEGDFKYQIHKNIIPHQNWNAQWEADFKPVFIEEYATILAPFHDKQSAKGMLVEIQPQMSFGTGHHQTTWMMTKALFELEKMPEKVLDMGTGTGVLAIVAEKLGANKILAIDIEDWSTENARENVKRNGCSKIECLCGDVDLVGDEKFGLIIANINKNVLKSHMSAYANSLNDNGLLLLSGFFSSDVDELLDFANQFGLVKLKEFSKDEWAGLQLIKKL